MLFASAATVSHPANNPDGRVKHINNYRVAKSDEGRWISMFEGVERKTLVHGAKTILCKFVLEKGTTLPLHRHPHEQTGHLLSGKILFTIEGSRQEIGPGDSWCIGENIEHGVEVLEKAVLLELFSPVRQDYLD